MDDGFFDEARKLVFWAKMNRAESVEVPTEIGPIKISFRQPNEREVLNEQIATLQQMSPIERAKLENLTDEQKEEHLKRRHDQDEQAEFWSA